MKTEPLNFQRKHVLSLGDTVETGDLNTRTELQISLSMDIKSGVHPFHLTLS